MASVLSGLFGGDKEIKFRLESIDSTLKQIYAVQIEERREAEERYRRQQQAEKRRKADTKAKIEKEEKDKDKKEKKGLLGILGGLLGKAFGGIGKLIAAGLKTALGKLGLAGIISKALAKVGLGGLLKAAFAKGLAFLGTAVFWKGLGIAAAVAAAVKGVVQANDAVYRAVGGTAETESGTVFDLQDIQEKKDSYNKLANDQGMTWEQKKPRLEQFEELQSQMRANKSVNDQLERDKKMLANKELHLKSLEGKEDKESRMMTQRLKHSIEALTKSIDDAEVNKVQGQKKATALFKKLMISDKDLVQHQIKMGRRGINDIPEHLRDQEFTNKDGARIFIEAYTDQSYEAKQLGGPINVPGTGSGDKVPMMLPANSFVMNRNAVHRQSGGMVPTLLEPGEQVYMPGQWGGAEMLMNSMFPRFQNGGQVSQSVAGGARGGTPPKLITIKKSRDYQAEAEDAKKSGKDAILSAAESSIGMSQGVGEQCANTTRAVLAKAGHPAANKTTSTGDLDPEGLAYNGPSFAASFAGSDMGDVKKDYKSTSAGDVILWRDTYGKYAPGAITHVGIKGEGSDVYHHGRSAGWRKQSGYPLSANFAAGIDLNGTASGTPGAGPAGPAGPAGNSETKTKNLGLTGEVGEFFSTLVGGLGDILGDISGGILGGLGGLLSSPSQDTPAGPAGPAGPANFTPGQGGGGATSVNDPNAKALLNAIADAEGTSSYPDQGYKTHFGGSQWKGEGYPKAHPAKDTGNSDAFGRYQFMSPTWNEYSNGRGMSPGEQDAVALDLITKKRGVNLSDGLSKDEVKKLSWEWASIKGNNYTYNGAAQGKIGQDAFLEMYKNYGGKIQGRQSGGAVTAKPVSSSSAAKSQEQFLSRMSEAAQPIVIPVPMGGGGGGGGSQSGGGGNQPHVPDLPSHPSGNIALDNAFRLSLGAAFG